MSRSIPVAMCVVVALSVVPAAGVAAATGGDDATVTMMHETVGVRGKGRQRFVEVVEVKPVRLGAVVRTDANGLAQVDYGGGSYTRLDHRTRFVVQRLTNRKGERRVRTELLSGRTLNRIEELTESESFEQGSDTTTVAVRGTTFAVRNATKRKKQTATFTVYQGEVRVKPEGERAVTLTEGEQVKVVDGDPKAVRTLPPEALCVDQLTCFGIVGLPLPDVDDIGGPINIGGIAFDTYYGFSRVPGPDGDWFVHVVRYQDQDVLLLVDPTRQIVAAVAGPRGSEVRNAGITPCTGGPLRLDGGDPLVLAPPDGGPATAAWQPDPVAQRFVPVPTEGITCEGFFQT